MSYNTILDGYFSSFAISLGIPFLLLILYYVFRSKIRKGKENSFGEVVVVFGTLFVLMMIAGLVNPIYWGFGDPEAVREIRYTKDKLLVVDHIMTMGGEGDEGTPCSRVHVIDPKTGTKQLRFTLGEEADLVALHGDTLVVVKYNEAIAYSLSDGHEYATYSQETLPALFPELACGIDNIMWGSDFRELFGQGYSVMEITANDGKLYALYLQTGRLEPAESNWASPERKPTGEMYFTDDEILIDDDSYSNAVLELDGQDGNQYQLYLEDGRDSIVNKNLTFLDAEFIGVDNRDSTCFILSYETLEHFEFVLTCVSLDGKEIRWQVHQSQFNSEYDFNDWILPHTGYSEAMNQITFWIAGDVYTLDARTGRLLWQTKL